MNGGHDVPISKLIARRLRGFENIKTAMPMIDCLLFVDNSLYGESPQILKSFYHANLCYDNSEAVLDERPCEWLNEVIGIADKSSVEIPQHIIDQHLTFCQDIQQSAQSFIETSNLTYQEKHDILSATKQ